MSEMQTVELSKYDPLKAQIAEFEHLNASLHFDYNDPAGNKNARSHVYKMRQMKGEVARVHKELKSDVLVFARTIDNAKNVLTGKLDGMIEIHQKPLDDIENAAKAKAEAEARAIEEARLEAERELQAEKDAAIAAEREAAREVAAELAQLKAREERDRIARDAAEQARAMAEHKAAREKAEMEARERKAVQDKIDAERAAVEAERKAIEAERRAIAEAKAAEERAVIAKAEAERQATLAAERAEAAKVEAAAKAERDKAEAIRIAQQEAERRQQQAIEAEKARAEAARVAEEKARKQKKVREGMITALSAELEKHMLITEDPKEEVPTLARNLATAIIDGKIANLTYHRQL